jgi:CheY-like chemotaxis protein
MKKKLNCILLIDDDYATNLYHKMIIQEANCTHKIVVITCAIEALEYFKSPFDEENPRPNLVFLDINMPKMTGWEFMEEYKHLEYSQKAENIIVMLSTSSHPDDIQKAQDNPLIKEYRGKPLSEEIIHDLVAKYWERIKIQNLV